MIEFPPKWAKFTNFQPVGFEAPCIFFILAKKIRLSENPISVKNKHARVVLHFWSKCKKSSKKECVIPSLYTDFAFTNIFFLDYILWSIHMTNPNQFLFWGHPFLQKSQEKNEIFTKKWAFFMIFQCFFILLQMW